ncbi:hypothetical protein Tco_1463474, partial [Tanacetum coccineum]
FAQLPQAAQPAVVPLVGPNANPLDLFPQGLPDMGANAPEPARNDSVYENRNTYDAEPAHNPQGSFPDVELLASQSRLPTWNAGQSCTLSYIALRYFTKRKLHVGSCKEDIKICGILIR